MTIFTEARYGLSFGFVPGDNGWGSSFNKQVKTMGALVNCLLQSDTLTNPPSSPADGDAYYIPSGATGAWAGHTGYITAYQGGAWQFFTTPKGLRAYIISRTSFYWFNGSSWFPESSAVAAVTSVNGNSGAVTLSASDIGAATPTSVTSSITTALGSFANSVFSSGTLGDIVVYSSSGWSRLGHGTEGQLLSTHGTTSPPSWVDPPAGTGGSGGSGVTSGSTIAPAAVNAPDDFAATSIATGSDLSIRAGGGTAHGGTLYLKGGRSDQNPGPVVIQGGGGSTSSDSSATSAGVTISSPNVSGSTSTAGDIRLTPGVKTGTGSGRNGLVLIDNLPTAYPGVNNALWLNNGVLCVGLPTTGGSTDPNAHRYWRLNVSNNGYGNFPGFAEVTAFATSGGSNLLSASGVTFSASSSNSSDSSPEKASDGNDSTNWTGNGLPSWWSFDLGSGGQQPIVQFTIKARNDSSAGASCAPSAFTLEYSDNGTGWTSKQSYTSSSSWGVGETRTFTVS